MKYPVAYIAVLGLSLAATVMPASAQTPQPGSPPAASSGIGVKVGTLEVRDLAFDLPGHGKWSIGRIGFTGFVRNGGRVRAERIDVDKVVMTFGSQTMEIPSIVMSGADLPEPLFRALTAGEPAGDLAGLLASATIDRIAVDRIEQRDSSVQLEATHNGLVITGIKDGIFASARIGGSTATMAGPPGTTNKVHVRLGELHDEQVDFAETVRMFTGGGNGGAKRVLQRAVIDGIDVTTDQATVHVKRVEIADIEGRAPAQPLPLQLRMQAASAKGSLDPEQSKLAAAFVSDIVRFARIGRYSIEGISVSVPPQGSFSIGAITIDGFSMRGIDRIAITGFDLRVPGAPVHFDRFELRGINYGALIEAALNAAASGVKLDPPPAQIAQMIPRLAAIQLSQLNAETPQGPIALGDLRFEMEERSEATQTNSAISGLTIDLRRLSANDGGDKLVALGYGRLTANAQARASWLRKERAVVVQTVWLSLDQIGRIEISARLNNVDVDKALADPTAGERVMGEAQLGPIEIRLANLGFAERFYADTAKHAGVSPDAIRAGLAAEMRSQAATSFGPLLTGGSADAIGKFLQSPGTIVARITPAAGQPPLTVAEVKSLPPPLLMQRLSVTLETKPN